jgi:hypothetical protein
MEATGHANPSYIRISPKKKWSWGIDDLSLKKEDLMLKEQQPQR